ncbi:MAG: hypothetical protein KDI79_29085 [Anaerolineae bacterium]|nr:hypothetical protein [Anaerolineae bacterium]
MTQASPSNLIPFLEVLDTDYIEKDQFIEYLASFDVADIQAIQALLRMAYRTKMVIEGEDLDPSQDWGPGRPIGLGRPGPSGPGGQSGPRRPGGRRR